MADQGVMWQVTWTIEVDGDNATDAALLCATILQDPANSATIFAVTPIDGELRPTGPTEMIDVGNYDDNRSPNRPYRPEV